MTPAIKTKNELPLLFEKNKNAEMLLSSIDAIDHVVSEYKNEIAKNAINSFRNALITAVAIKKIKELISQPIVDLLRSLMNTQSGFVTDHGPHAYRDDYKEPYHDDIMVNCAIEAILHGVLWTGNQFNIIASRCYITVDGYRYILANKQGLHNLVVVPSIPVIRDGQTVVRVAANWIYNDVHSTLKDHEGKPGRNFPITVNKSMGVDAIIGKAYRKAYKCIFDQINGCEWVDDEIPQVIDASPEKSNASALRERIENKRDEVQEKGEPKDALFADGPKTDRNNDPSR